jgi:hypothetical protein
MVALSFHRQPGWSGGGQETRTPLTWPAQITESSATTLGLLGAKWAMGLSFQPGEITSIWL